MKKTMPIGVEDFEKIKTENYYYVDKTLFIKELIDKKAVVNLFTRPRRFGKTLSLSMLKYFFEDDYDRRGNKKDFSHLFEDTLIAKCSKTEGVNYLSHMGKYPVISLTLKSGKQAEFSDCMRALVNNLADEFSRHRYILKDDVLSDREKAEFNAYMDKDADPLSYKDSLKFLCKCLNIWSDKKVIVLLDEYDVPLEGAYHYGFYDKMVDFIRGLFESTFKTNNNLYFAVITGCLRISKESIFTGLNNLRINTVLSDDYGEFFGFTEPEVMKLCEDYDLSDKYQEMHEWYNGYKFGKTNVYNPWSIIQYMYDHIVNKDRFPEAYWVNTSSNQIVRDLIDRADDEIKGMIEKLIAGGSITIPVHEDITYDEVYDSPDNLWNFMFFTGYFKKTGEFFENEQRYVTLEVSNTEIKYIFNRKVLNWFEDRIKETDRSALLNSIITGDCQTFTTELGNILASTISFYDYKESFYHGFVTGVIFGIAGYVVKSNREAGNGRSDLFIKPVTRSKAAIVIEFKIADSYPELESKAKEAIEQIINNKYEQELLDDGYMETKRYGIAFFKKDCLVVAG